MKITNKFYLHQDKGNENNRPIYLRLTLDRESTKRSIGHSINPKHWNEQKEDCKIIHINNTILKLKQKINDLQFELQKEPRNLVVKELADLIFEKSSLEVNLCAYFDNFAKNALDTKRISPGTYGQYQTCVTALKAFLKFKLKKEELNIKQFDHDLVEGFDTYIHSLGKGLNTVSNKYHKKLKTVLGDAQKRGIIKLNPYGLFKIRFNPTHRQFLSEQDLKKIVEVDLLGNLSLEKIRDMFLFSCYTGLRFGDAIDLALDQIYYEGENGSIYRAQNKTGETISIPLIPEALALIKKYDSDERKITGKVFPKISNQKFNLYLKSLATMANIQKELTHHVARHTCATTLINRGVSIDIVSKYLGHANTKATRIYAKMQDETVKKEIMRAFGMK